MVYFDENMNAIETPNLEAGTVTENPMQVTYAWVVDQPEQSHEEVVAVYEKTGGKDIRKVIDQPEQGHWEVTDENGRMLPIVDEVPPDWPKGEPIKQMYTAHVYRPYTKEELAEIEAARKQAENQPTNEDLMLAIAELGAMVG